MAGWTLDQLKAQLNSRKDISGWAVSQEHIHRRERYFLLEKQVLAVDQDRDTLSTSTTIKLLVKKAEAARQGEITKRLVPYRPLAEQIDAAIASAMQTDHQAWKLPEQPPRNLPTFKTADPRIAEDIESVMTQVTSCIGAAVVKKRATTFNSAELFVSVHDRELHLSNGLTHRSSQSRVYTEAAFSAGGNEYMTTQWAVNLDDLDIGRLYDETSERTEHSLALSKPLTGHYPVMIDSEVLLTILNGYICQLSGLSAYQRLPFIKPGDDLIPEATGDLLTITLDPTLDYGADTCAVSDQGVEQRKLVLVRDNKVVATATDQQHAHYLGTNPTAVRGSVVVGSGSLDYAGLTQAAPLVLEILQFSGLFADSNTGTFSSEIRLAKLYDNKRGTVSYLKGGSVSGSIRENFRNARFSRDLVRRAHFSSESPNGEGYYGPEYVLLGDVSVVG